MTNPGIFYFEDFWGIFVGSFPKNDFHSHYPVEINISLDKNIVINDGHSKQDLNCCLIKSNVRHKYESQELQLSLLLSPISPLAINLNTNHLGNDIVPIDNEWILQLKIYAVNLLQNKMSIDSCLKNTGELIRGVNDQFRAENNRIDCRIFALLKHLEKNSKEIISLTEASQYCSLSSSRLIHLFKTETGISFRRAQIWYKLVRAFKLFSGDMNLTQIAHACGFTDSAHFSKKFNETFGTPPSTFQKLATLYKHSVSGDSNFGPFKN